MKYLTKALAATALAGAMLLPAHAADDGEKAIKARQSLMQLYAWNLGLLGAMAKGDVEYNADAAEMAAKNLSALAAMNEARLWPQGTDSTAMAGKTRAKADAWADGLTIMEKHQALLDAAAAMNDAAGMGVEAVQENIKMVGGACGGCHKAYREEQ